MEKILLVSDGIIVLLLAGDNELNIQAGEVRLSVADYGAEMQIDEKSIRLPASVLAHFEETTEANIYFYESEPYRAVADYKGNVALNRDEVLKVKGAWEYQTQW